MFLIAIVVCATVQPVMAIGVGLAVYCAFYAVRKSFGHYSP